MKRILTFLTVALIVAAMVLATAVPAFARQGSGIGQGGPGGGFGGGGSAIAGSGGGFGSGFSQCGGGSGGTIIPAGAREGELAGGGGTSC